MSGAKRVNRMTRQPPTLDTIRLQNRNETNITVVQPRGEMTVMQPGENTSGVQPGGNMSMFFDPPPPYTPSKIAMRLIFQPLIDLFVETMETEEVFFNLK